MSFQHGYEQTIRAYNILTYTLTVITVEPFYNGHLLLKNFWLLLDGLLRRFDYLGPPYIGA